MATEMIFVPYTGSYENTRFLPIEGKTHRTDHLLPKFREGHEGYFSKKGETFFDAESETLYYRGYQVYAIYSPIYDEIQDGEPYQTTITRHGHMEGSTWDKTEEYSYQMSAIAQKYRKILKGVKCEKIARLGYKKDHDTNDWFPLPEGWESELKFYNVTEKHIVKYK